MSDEAEAKITHLADTQPDTPIGVAFVDAAGRPGWPGDNPLSRSITQASAAACRAWTGWSRRFQRVRKQQQQPVAPSSPKPASS